MTDSLSLAGFYLFAMLSIVGALFAVSSHRILRAAIGLAITLVAAAGLYALLGSGFLAAIQILVYVGGIVVLIVFAVMLTSSNETLESRPTAARRLLAILTGGIFTIVSVTAITQSSLSLNENASPPASDVSSIGHLMLSPVADGYLIAFEVISLLLLAAVIGAIVVARSEKHAKNQLPHLEKRHS